MAESGPNIAPFLDLAVQIIQASGGDTKRADEAAHILASSTAVNTYLAVEGLVKALERFTSATLTPNGNIAGLMREDFDCARSALSRFRSLQKGGAND